MRLEFNALERIKMWKFVDLIPRVKLIGCRWICKIKYLVDSLIDRFKDMLVEKCYN